MCIILAKPRGVELPPEKTLETCFKRNSDGAGFMYVDHNKVIIDKGFMNYKSFKKHYDKLCKKYHNFDNKSLVIHFRIGTDGSNIAKNTHPYPICENYNTMNKIYYKCDLGMVHNGIITDYRPTKADGDIVDTMKFIKDFIYPLKNGWSDFYKNSDMLKGLEYLTNSKLCFLDNKDNIYTSGYFIQDGGILYSNSTYKEYSYNYTNYKYPYESSTTATNNTISKIWNYTYKKDDTKESKTNTDSQIKKDDTFKELKSDDIIITQDGRRYKVNVNKLYYYDEFTNKLYRKDSNGAYIEKYSNCMLG